MIALGIILAHLVGDYILQNDWIANEKTKHWFPAVIHGLLYGLAYNLMLLITGTSAKVAPVLLALGIIIITHIVIDRFRLVKQLIWLLNQLAPARYRYSWAVAKTNGGYDPAKPVWMSTWLMIIVDNSIHLLINTLAIALLIGLK